MKVIIVVYKKDVAIGRRGFPFAKSNKNDRVRRDGVLSFLAASKFVANMSGKFGVVVDKSFAHAVSEHFGNECELFGRARRKSNIAIVRIVLMFSSESLGAGAAFKIANHIDRRLIIKCKVK